MERKTHHKADERFLGAVRKLEDGLAEVELETKSDMAVDGRGLVHGGFTFGLADYAAMLAVNHPNVVLGSSEVRFLGPVKSGDRIRAEARVSGREGKKVKVECEVFNQGNKKVFEGIFVCFIPDRHVLEK